jgi:predicted kinase
VPPAEAQGDIWKTRIQSCAENFTVENPWFALGQTTESGISPSEYFKSATGTDGRPRIVMLVGIAGSGKSTWSRHADPGTWTTISVDVIRRGIMDRIQSLTPERTVRPFDSDIAAETTQTLLDFISQAVAEGRNIILDQNNTLPSRSEYFRDARIRGYQTEGLVFVSESADVNFRNVSQRKNHLFNGIAAEEIQLRFDHFIFYNDRFRIRPLDFRQAPQTPEISVSEVVNISDSYPDLETALRELPSPKKEALIQLLDQDYFHEVSFVWTPDVQALKQAE